MSKPLAGRRAFVTGSSALLGEGIALRLAQDGAAVCLHGRNLERLAAATKRVAAAVDTPVYSASGTLSDDASAAGVYAAAEKALGGIDILVNNAGGESSGGGSGPWLESTPDDWVQNYNSNVASMVRLIKRAVPGMKARGWGRIINLSSVSVDMPMTVIPDYQAAKAGIRTLTRSLAATLAHTGITVNSISPGLTHSTGPERWLRGIAAAQGWSDDWAEIRAIVERDMIKNFTGKMGEPADIAHAVAFLADPRGGQVNAIDIVIDGGH